MIINAALVLLFGLNQLLIWVSNRYRPAGTFVFVLLPLAGVFVDQPRFELDYFWWRLAGVAAILLGLALIGWAQKTLGLVRLWVAESPEELVESGPYQFVRHPIYLGLILIFTGWWWLWSAVYTFYFGMLILSLIWLEGYLEERFILLIKFGDKYLMYRQRTGMFWIK